MSTATIAAAKPLKAPFPWFGGKSRAAPLVWERFGEVRNYVEPFAGSLAVLLGRPTPFAGTETVNDLDGYISNFWRAIKADPAAVARHADWPVNENDLHARHSWLVGRKEALQARLEGDPDYHDATIAGWWAWGIACWIGSGFCSGKGPWQVVNRKLVRLGNAGQGVNRQRVHLGDAGQDEATRELGSTANVSSGLLAWLEDLSDRLARVRVCCGDWRRVCGPAPTVRLAQPCAVFLDPPYADTAKRTSDLYRVDSESVAHDVRDWAVAHGDDPRYRICLAGYEGEHRMPKSWKCIEGKATTGGYGAKAKTNKMNHLKERLWFSPYCLAT